MQVVIPSKGRSKTIRKHTLHLFPDATVVVDEAEADDYLRVVDRDKLVTHPGLQNEGGAVRIMNFILDTFSKPGEVFVTADDDIRELRAMPGWRPRVYHDPDVANAVLEGAAQCALDAGAAMFGFNQNELPLYFRPHEPFRLNRWIGTVIGHIGTHGLRFDERAHCHGDADLCLQSLLKHRIVWCDQRWSFVCIRLRNAGGNTGQRDAGRDEEERRYLKRKWGPYIAFTTQSVDHDRRKRGLPATTLITSLRVQRRQST